MAHEHYNIHNILIICICLPDLLNTHPDNAAAQTSHALVVQDVSAWTLILEPSKWLNVQSAIYHLLNEGDSWC